eukprot:TRINITY_DN16248_c0_g1_i1.p1 TRINITY_DN16248_c0_g1~~TRINITY_DN16248_c0_g1_i1.p1  ORF type:complete len:1826 (+),score=569.30 TRINITY_DN16248_c0_g1_i1:99-5576(+)
MLAAVAAAVLTGEPECAHDPFSCMAELGGGRFLEALAPEYCDMDNWRRRELCLTHCPNSLVVTAPKEYAARLCLHPRLYSQGMDNVTMSTTHPLNNKPLRLSSANFAGEDLSDRRLLGCTNASYTEGDFAGTVALMKRGGCKFQDKGTAAERAGAAAAIVVNIQKDERYGPGENAQLMAPAFQHLYPISIPFFMISLMDGDVLLQALRRGVHLEARLSFTCAPPPALVVPKPFWAGNCPSDLDSVKAKCAAQEGEARLCDEAGCALHLTLGGLLPAPMCLYGNRLWPRAEANTYWAMGDPPYSISRAREVVLVADGASLPKGGCFASDFAPLGLKGKVLVIHQPHHCVGMALARAAMDAGVAGLILLSRQSRGNVYLLLGSSAFVDIPVQSLSSADSDKVLAAVEDHGQRYAFPEGTPADYTAAYRLPNASVHHPMVLHQFGYGAFDVQNGTDPLLDTGAGRPSDDGASPASTRRALLVFLPFAALLLGVLVWKVAELCRMAQRSAAGAGRAVAGDEKRPWSIPLGVANMLLGFTLLAIVAVVLFVLSSDAGRRAAATAIFDGRVAATKAHSVALENAEVLAGEMRATILLMTATQIRARIEQGHTLAANVASIYQNMGDHSWASFDRLSLIFSDLVTSGSHKRWLSRVDTTEHRFYVTDISRTDSRSDAERDDNVTGAVDETNDGTLYGYSTYLYSPETKKRQHWFSRRLWEDNVPYTHIRGQRYGDPLEPVRDSPEGFRQWEVVERRWPLMWPSVPTGMVPEDYSLTLFVPLYNRAFMRVGVGSFKLSLDVFRTELNMTVQGASENATVAVVETAAPHRVIFSNRAHLKVFAAAIVLSEALPYEELYTLHDVPAVELNMLGALLNASTIPRMNAGLFSTEASQKKYIPRRSNLRFALELPQPLGGGGSPPPPVASLYSLRSLRKREGGLIDRSGNAWCAGFEAGGWQAVVDTHRARPRRVLHLDGAASTVLLIHRELTTNQPDVAATARPNADGSWNSTSVFFQNGVQEIEEGVFCPRTKMPYVKGEPTQWQCLLRATGLGAANAQPHSVSIAVRPDTGIRPPKDQAYRLTFPRILSATPKGQNYMRIYGDGKLALMVGSKRCEIAPPADGLPGGAWTAVTAVVDELHTYCALYLNGTLHGRDILRQMKSLSGGDSPAPHAIGQNFRGAIDAIYAHDFALSGPEVAELHAGMLGGAPRVDFEVVPRDWYVDVQRYTEDSATVAGMDWLISALLPVDDVMRKVRDNNAVLLATLRRQAEATDAKLTDETHLMIVVAIIIVLASGVVFLLFNETITGPFARITEVLVDVSMLKVDKTGLLARQNSSITEVMVAQSAVLAMADSLREFRTYLPQSVFAAIRAAKRRDAEDDIGTGSGSGSFTADTVDTDDRSDDGDAWDSIGRSGAARRVSLEQPPRSSRTSPTASAAVPLTNAREALQSALGDETDSVVVYDGDGNVEVVDVSAPLPVPNPVASPLQQRATAERRHNADGTNVLVGPASFGSDMALLDGGNQLLPVPHSPVKHRRVRASGAPPMLGPVVNPLHLGLSRRKFTLYMMNVRGFHELIQGKTERQVLNLVERVLLAVVGATARNQGVLERFSGDRFLASFNASRPMGQHPQAAVQTSFAVVCELCENQKIGAVCSAVVTGRGMIGNTGTQDLRSYSFLTPIFSYGAALLQLASALQVFGLCTHETKARLDASCLHRLIAGVKFAQLSSLPQPVYELYARVGDGSVGDSTNNAHWMVSDDGAATVRAGIDAWNQWCAAIMSRNWDAADVHADAARAHDNDSVAYDLLEDAQNTNCYEPIDLNVPYLLRGARRLSSASWG